MTQGSGSLSGTFQRGVEHNTGHQRRRQPNLSGRSAHQEQCQYSMGQGCVKIHHLQCRRKTDGAPAGLVGVATRKATSTISQAPKSIGCARTVEIPRRVDLNQRDNPTRVAVGKKARAPTSCNTSSTLPEQAQSSKYQGRNKCTTGQRQLGIAGLLRNTRCALFFLRTYVNSVSSNRMEKQDPATETQSFTGPEWSIASVDH